MLLTERDRLTPDARPTGSRAWGIPLVFGLVATAVAASGSWIPSLWGDEAATIMSAERPVGTLVTMLFHVDAVHGLFYLMMHGWIAVFGASPFSVRLPSAFAVGLAVAAVTVLAGRRGGPTAAIVAGVVATVLPRLTYAGEEARSFAASAAIASWLTVLFVWLIDRRGSQATPAARRLGWIAYGVLLGLGTWLFLYFATIAIAHAAVLLATRAQRPTLRAWAIATGAAFLAASPLILVAYFERGQISYLGRQPTVQPSLLYSTWFDNRWVATAAWALILFGLWTTWRAWRRSRADRTGSPRPWAQEPSLPLVAAAWLFLPTGSLLLVDLLFPLYTPRYSTFAAPAAALLIAHGILALSGRVGRGHPRRQLVATVTVTVLFVAVCVPAYLGQRGPYSKNDSDWAEVSAAVGHYARPGDAVVFDDAARPSQRPRLAMHTYPAGFTAVTDPTVKVPFTANRTWYDSTYTVAHAAELGRFDGVHRVWALENDIGGKQDTYGLADLEHLGFTATGLRVHTHRTVLIEYTR